jgi:hypothetical protein
MSENSFKSVRNGVIASVVAGIILLVVPMLRGYVLSFISWIWSVLIWCWELLVASYSLPGWAWLIIAVFTLVGLVNIYLAIKGKSEQPEFKLYVEDSIHGVKWRWSWVGNQISNIWCYCPSCDATLVYDDSSCSNYLSDIKKTDFICENCGHSIVASIAGGNKNYAISAIRREIDRRIRKDMHKKH